MKNANADIVAIAAHPFTTCGVLKEMQRQGVKPKVLVGLTSSSSLETLQGCAKQAEGMIIPTTFAPVTKEGDRGGEATAKFKGAADLHSMAAWENMFILKQVIESEKISAQARQLQADRRKIRDGLAKLKDDQGAARRDQAHRGPRGGQALRLRPCEERRLGGLHNPLVQGDRPPRGCTDAPATYGARRRPTTRTPVHRPRCSISCRRSRRRAVRRDLRADRYRLHAGVRRDAQAQPGLRRRLGRRARTAAC